MSEDLNRLPPQTKYIVGNEACERLSFYGMRAILTVFLGKVIFAGSATASGDAEAVYHYFNGAIYFLAIGGAFLADRLWGKYKTILLLSLGYCVGHGLLAASEFAGSPEARKWIFFAGLAAIAIGGGGIKPCVSAFAGEQFTGGREHLLPKIYSLFYWSINFGSFIGIAMIPWVRDRWGYAWAFGIPGIFMAIATLIFWMGRATYIVKPPTRHVAPADPATRAADTKTLLRIALVFSPIPVFWALFDQTGSTWVQQGAKMTPFTIEWLGGYRLDAETIQTLNPLLVMALIPFCVKVLYPAMERFVCKPTALRRMGAGMVFAAAAFVITAWLQHRVDGQEKLSIVWQMIPYVVITIGEVLLSATGLEFAFSQAPARLKSTIMSLWLLTVFFGNLLAGVVAQLNANIFKFSGSTKMLFYAALMFVVAGLFALIARKFPESHPAK
jgi:proton-dependent oligopeptide transporter, POT family